jgi:hypothetical protein
LADIIEVLVEQPPGSFEAMTLTGGAAARVIDSTFNSKDASIPTVSLSRSSSARFDGANLIENEAGGPAIEVLHTSNIRVQNNPTYAILGSVIIGNNSVAILREINVTESIVLQRDSNLALRANSSITVFGSVTIEDQSLLETDGPNGNVTILGGVTCVGGAAGGVINPAAIVGGVDGSTCTEF